MWDFQLIPHLCIPTNPKKKKLQKEEPVTDTVKEGKKSKKNGLRRKIILSFSKASNLAPLDLG